MEVLITSANCEIAKSGLVTSFEGKPIEIMIPNQDKTNYKIKFQFEKNIKIKEQKMEILSDKNSICFLLINFSSPLGTGTPRPIPFAVDDSGKKLYINFYVYIVGEASPTLHYTIYKEI